MIIEMLIFIWLWFTMCGLWHETMHLVECERQGCGSSYMYIRLKPIPTMRFFYIKCTDSNLVLLAGGLYTSLLCFLLFFITMNIWFDMAYIFLVLGWVQLIYGIFEMVFIRKLNSKQYTIGRYSIYIGIVLIGLLWRIAC